MKHNQKHLIYLLIGILFLLSACEKAVIELPPEEPTATTETIIIEEEPTEEPSEPVSEFQLGVGSTMKWYDDGYVVFVPKGEVILGDNQYENNPEHTADLEGYWIYKFPVTNGQYQHCITAGACTNPASGEPYPDLYDPESKDDPVVGVNWEQANSYCDWMKARLPSDDEWEKAARGPEAFTFPWGEDDPDCDLTNYGECEEPEITEVHVHPDGMSYYEAFDLAGNTYEWVNDLYEDEFISLAPGLDQDQEIPDGTERGVRGSSYQSDVEFIPSAQRFYQEPEKQVSSLGFRCVLTGGEEPDGYANPCVQTAFIEGLSAPWQPGPPAADENELPDFPDPTCNPDYDVDFNYYCSDQTLQYGGLDAYLTGFNNTDINLVSYDSNSGVYCDDTSDPIKCFGPKNTQVSLQICASCTPIISWYAPQFGCDGCYSIADTDPPSCVWTGGPPPPGQPCPGGFAYDQVNDICVKIGMPSMECPKGYVYNDDTDCCEATFAPPAPDGTPSSNSYLTCPPGYGNVVLNDANYQEGNQYVTCNYFVYPTQDYEICHTWTETLGDCREIPKDKKCVNPGQYTAQGPCEAAYCKWTMGPTGADVCTSP